MSWLSIPLPNLFKSQPPDDEEDSEEESSSHGGARVKEDLSELGKTIGRQLWGVASFLAPPPSLTSSVEPTVDSISTHDFSSSSSSSSSSSQTLVGIRNDFSEIGGSLKSGLSLFSTNKAVNEISQFASNFLLSPKDGEDFDEVSVEDNDDDGDIVGVTEEVLEFVLEISMRTECWTDFPLSLETAYYLNPKYQYSRNLGLDDDLIRAVHTVVEKLEPDADIQSRCIDEMKSFRDGNGSFGRLSATRGRDGANPDFEMSKAQWEHASTVEDLTPSLVAVKVRLCPSHMNEGQFWMIYFILLHPRLNEHDSKLLSTTQIIEARDSLLQKLQKRVYEQVESSKNNDSSIEVSDKGTKLQEESNLVQEKEVLVETVNAPHHIEAAEQENTEQWLEEEDETDTSVAPQKQLGNEDDVSFSDLEDDDDDDNSPSRQRSLNLEKDIGVSSPNGSNEWVRLSENSDSREKKVVQTTSQEKDSEGDDSNDWLTVDDFD